MYPRFAQFLRIVSWMPCLSDICFVVSQFDIKKRNQINNINQSRTFYYKRVRSCHIPLIGGSNGYLMYTGRQPVPYEKSQKYRRLPVSEKKIRYDFLFTEETHNRTPLNGMLRSDDKVTNSFRKITKEANKCLGKIRNKAIVTII